MGTVVKERTKEDLARISLYEEGLMDGRVFRNHARSAGSIIGYQPPTGEDRFQKAMAILVNAMRGSKQTKLMWLASRALSPYREPGKNVEAMYREVAKTLDGGHDDVVLKASPEPGRRQDWHTEYTLADRLRAMDTLTDAAGAMLCEGNGNGWCWQALAEREGVSW